jgi:hypothetical protein
MFSRHPSDRLAAYLDGAMSIADRTRVDAHLANCAQCREELEQIQTGVTALEHLGMVSAPIGLWSAIEATADSQPPRPRFRLPMWRLALAGLIIAITAGGYRIWSARNVALWQVVALEGAPIAASQVISGSESVRNGNWVETDAASRARIVIGAIGSVRVEPNSRVRLLSSDSSGHRLALQSGGIQASISALPRLFFVETPAGTAIDLGCEYDLRCDRQGTGMLQVTSGWVALEWRGRESLVPAGASCRTYSGRGPGVPWFNDASNGFLRALEDMESRKEDALARILAEARARDTLTLWHLLAQVELVNRLRVFERMTTLVPLPSGVSRERVLDLDRQSLQRWREELAWIW